MSHPEPRPSGTTDRRRLHRAVRRWLWRSRFAVVAVCCGVSATSAVQALRPEPPPMRDVVVPAHRLAAGVEVERTDLEVRPVPASLTPQGALTDPADAVGRVPPVALPSGLPLSADLLAGGAVTALAPGGTVVVPVRLDAATARLLRAGDHADLVSSTALSADDGAADSPYLARRALVLPAAGRTAPDDDDGPAGLLGGAKGTDADPVTLFAVAPDEAPGLSAASGAGAVAAVLVP
ncbi:flagellar biosynthesis protein FlgA [Xylanimonas allomyrinae]|uniref:Flagellar biosynthesis protein FlgA n=1 Tax=Xylanimonas allomyrinae TaxID=2509459 RepID=A0A4P6ELP1_9MICO|nr:SAF domain-containing protein [Xylanimonas allomyrinae]QAY63562.1 flagellar biosynthesis protein FlgA [Xylanimonas allomyrinae]